MHNFYLLVQRDKRFLCQIVKSYHWNGNKWHHQDELQGNQGVGVWWQVQLQYLWLSVMQWRLEMQLMLDHMRRHTILKN